MADLRGDSNWITNKKSREHAMYLRFINDAVLVGAQTVRHDNPHLNIRGYDKKRPFYKIIISKNSIFRRPQMFLKRKEIRLFSVGKMQIKKR